MKHRARRMLIFVGMALVPALILSQEGLVSVGTVTKQSDVIVVGRSTPIDPTGANGAVLTIKVVRVVKGDAAPGEILTVTGGSSNTAGCLYDPPYEPAYAIWFLETNPSGDHILLPSLRSQRCDPSNSSYQLTEEALPSQWTYGPEASSADKLAYEFAATILSRQGEAPLAFISNPFLLDGASREALRKIYRTFEKQEAVHVRMVGLAGLVGIGDLGTLAYLKENLSSLISIPIAVHQNRLGQLILLTTGKDGTQRPTYAYLFARAISKIANTDDATVSVLGSLLDAPDSTMEMKRSVAHALQSIHTPLAVQELAPLLADSDEEIRDYAIGGIACFANGCPVIGWDDGASTGPDLSKGSPYKSRETLVHFAMGVQTISQREDYYLSFWRQWWSQNAASIIGQTKTTDR